MNYKKTLYTCYLAYITQAIIVNLPPILFIVFRERFGFSYAQLSLLIMISFVTQILVDILSIKLTKILGYRRYAVIAHMIAAVGLVLLGVLPEIIGRLTSSSSAAYAAALFATLMTSAGSGIIEVLVSPIVEALPGDAKASAMSLLHGFYSWGAVAVISVSTIALSLIGHDRWFIIPICCAAVPALNIYRFSVVPIIELEDGKEETVPLSVLFGRRLFILAVIMMICSGAAEQSMNQWASLFAERGLGVTKTLGDLLGPCLFAVLMGIGRTLYGIFGEKFDTAKAIWLLSLLTIGCYALTAFVDIPAVGLAACGLCGFGVSLMWPGMLSVASAKNPDGGTPMFSVMAMGGDIGCSFGPWITGMVSDSVIAHGAPESAGLRLGLLAAMVFPVMIALLMPCFFGKKKSK